MEEKERGVEAMHVTDVEAGRTPPAEIRPSRAFTSALTQSISARTLLAVSPSCGRGDEDLKSPFDRSSSTDGLGSAESGIDSTPEGVPVPSVTFSAQPAAHLIGSPLGYFVRGDRQSPGHGQEGSTLRQMLSRESLRRRSATFEGGSLPPTPRHSHLPSPRPSFDQQPLDFREGGAATEPLLGSSGPSANDTWPTSEMPGRWPTRQPPKQQQGSRRTAVLMATVFGMINSVVAIPAMISFTAIIYQDPMYEPHLPQLAKLAFLASAIHQTVFLLSSTLPFAVGQVQDVGLIFLSAMASSIAVRCIDEGLSTRVALGTTLATQAVSTLLVGLFIILVGKLRLASLVQYVPLPVVGGYLGYVGFFCFIAGVSLATGVQVREGGHILELLGEAPALKLAAALAGSAAMAGSLHLMRHPLALPAMLLAIPAIFYACLAALGISLQQARDAGWVAQLEAGPHSWRFWEIYKLYNIHDWSLDGLYFPAMYRQLPTLFPLFFVVAFGSSMDVAAISQEMNGAPLDYDTELLTVGYANLAAGLAGAPMTGSYIFSQTIFSMRSGVTSRANGLIVAIVELFLFAAPFSALPYLPSFYFGSLMMLIGWEIIRDWLMGSYYKVTPKEFGLLWATFIAISLGGLELGIGAGIVMATLSFAYSYARVHVTAFTLVPSRSSTMRPFEQRAVLELFSQRMAAVALSGYIFFGSAVTISKRVMEVAQALLDAHPQDTGASNVAETLSSSKAAPGSSWFEGAAEERAAAALAVAPRVILLDFRNVNGLDATAARTFGSLAAALHTRGARLLVTHVRKRAMQRLLAAHGVAAEQAAGGDGSAEGGGPCLLFPTMDAALEYCEDEFLRIACVYRLCKPPASSMTLAEILRSHLEAPKVLMAAPVDYARTAATLMSFMERREMAAGHEVFRPGDPADEIFIIEQGTIRVQMDYLGTETAAVELPEEVSARATFRYFNMGPASIVGDMDFFLQRARSFQAVCATNCSVLCMTRDGFGQLSLQAPQALIVLQTIMLRSASLNETHALEVLERSSLPR